MNQKYVGKTKEKRHFHRIMHDAGATLAVENGSLPCTVTDISLKGCLLELAEAHVLDPARTYRLSIILSETLKIEMDVSPAHQEGRRAGFICRQIDPVSIATLKRLIELNLGDPALLERELQALAAHDRELTNLGN